MNKIENILVPTDFFEGFELALNYAKFISKLTGALIHIIHVVEPSVYPADLGFSQISYVDVENELKTSSELELIRISKQLESEGIKFKTALFYGKPSDQIIAYAAENSIDMICITTQARNSLDRFIFGSTTERVLRKADCPVVTLRISK